MARFRDCATSLLLLTVFVTASSAWAEIADKTSTEQLLTYVRDGDTEQKIRALGELGQRLRSLPEETLQTTLVLIADTLKDPNPSVRESAARAVGWGGSQPGREVMSKMLPELTRCLGDDVMSVRREAARSLFHIGPNADSAEALFKSIDDQSPEVRCQVISAIGRLGPAAEPATDRLVSILGIEENPPVPRSRSIEGPDGSKRTIYVSDSMRRPQVYAAERALERLGSTSLPALRRGLQSEDPTIGVECAQVLGELDLNGLPAIPDLTALMECENEDLRCAAAISLCVLKPRAVETLPVLQECLRGKDVERRFRALAVLQRLGCSAQDLVPDILKLTKELGNETTGGYMMTLSVIACGNQEAVEAVKEYLGNLPKEEREISEQLFNDPSSSLLHYQFKGSVSRIESREYHRILNQTDLEALWVRHVGSKEYLPPIDFETEMAIAVFEGKMWNSWGFRCISVAKGDEILIRFIDDGYQVGVVSDDVTPYGFFIVERSGLPIRLDENRPMFLGAPTKWVTAATFPAVESGS
jgi:HEAT repeat protein